MGKRKKQLTFSIIDLIFFCFATLILGFGIACIIKDIEVKNNFNKGYKQGQIDCLNGIQNYDKAVKKDTIYFKIK